MTGIRRRINEYLQHEEMSWARLVSDILSPPVVWGVLALPISFRVAPSQEQALLWALVYIVMVCVIPIVYVVWMVRRGEITDIHMKVRQQRLRPLLVSMVCTAIAWWTLRLMGAPPVVPLLALFSFVQISVITLITLVWQVSMHAMSISGAMIAAGALFGAVFAVLVAPLVVLVCVARLKLERHTPAQVIIGVLIGSVIPLVLLSAVMI